jgi:hypothetical protein
MAWGDSDLNGGSWWSIEGGRKRALAAAVGRSETLGLQKRRRRHAARRQDGGANMALQIGAAGMGGFIGTVL